LRDLPIAAADGDGRGRILGYIEPSATRITDRGDIGRRRQNSAEPDALPLYDPEIVQLDIFCSAVLFDCDGVLVDSRHVVRAGQGLTVNPGEEHVVRNESGKPARFLAVASPTTYGDREDSLA
jgi:hypothetical protein